jgi:uncharacterized membrane protein (DUF485 family)
MSHSELQRTYKQARKYSNNKTKVRQFYNKLLADYYSNLPKIKIEPKLEDFCLSNEIIAANNQFKLKKREKSKHITMSVLSLIYSFCFFYILISTSHNTLNNMYTNNPVNVSIISAILFPLVAGIAILLALLTCRFFMPAEGETDVDKKLKEFNLYVDAYNYYKEQKKKEYWLNMSGRDFEVSLAKIFKDNGYKTELTQASADGGVDIIIYENEQPVFVQCKAYNKPVGVAVARELYGVMQDKNVEQGVIATLNGVTQGVYDFVNGKNIKLIDLVDILKMVEN